MSSPNFAYTGQHELTFARLLREVGGVVEPPVSVEVFDLKTPEGRAAAAVALHATLAQDSLGDEPFEGPRPLEWYQRVVSTARAAGQAVFHVTRIGRDDIRDFDPFSIERSLTI